jgi:hypothetical protein
MPTEIQLGCNRSKIKELNMQANVHGCDRSLKETVLSVRYELRSKNSYLKNKE